MKTYHFKAIIFWVGTIRALGSGILKKTPLQNLMPVLAKKIPVPKKFPQIHSIPEPNDKV